MTWNGMEGKIAMVSKMCFFFTALKNFRLPQVDCSFSLLFSVFSVHIYHRLGVQCDFDGPGLMDILIPDT